MRVLEMRLMIPLLAIATLLVAMVLVPTADALSAGDIRHIKEVQSYPTWLPASIAPPLVYCLGDSTTRESVVSEAELEAKVLAVSGIQTQARILASSNQTFPMDQLVAAGLPAEPALVLIGVGLSRFTNGPGVPTLGEPLQAVTQVSPWRQHMYSENEVLTVAQKRAKVHEWLAQRYPLFKKNEPLELAKLKLLVQACKDRGWKVALVEMPLNLAIVKHAFDAPLAKYRAGCEAVAAMHDIPYLRFVGSVGLTNADFYDLIHLVGNGPKGGRTKWQASLAAQIAPLLAPTQP